MRTLGGVAVAFVLAVSCSSAPNQTERLERAALGAAVAELAADVDRGLSFLASACNVRFEAYLAALNDALVQFDERLGTPASQVVVSGVDVTTEGDVGTVVVEVSPGGKLRPEAWINDDGEWRRSSCAPGLSLPEPA